MTAVELREMRQRLWAAWLAGGATSDQLRRLIEAVGFLFASGAAWPSLELWVAANAAATPSEAAAEVRGWLAEHVRAGRILEIWLWPAGPVYLPRELLPHLYVWRGDRDPRHDCERQVRQGALSTLAGEAYASLLAGQALTATELRARLGAGRVSLLAVGRAVHDLAALLKIVPVEIGGEEPRWRPTFLAFPEASRALNTLSRPAAAAALVGKYLEVAALAEEAEVAAFFAPLLPRTAVRAALAALAAANQIAPEAVEGRPAAHWLSRGY